MVASSAFAVGLVAVTLVTAGCREFTYPAPGKHPDFYMTDAFGQIFRASGGVATPALVATVPGFRITSMHGLPSGAILAAAYSGATSAPTVHVFTLKQGAHTDLGSIPLGWYSASPFAAIGDGAMLVSGTGLNLVVMRLEPSLPVVSESEFPSVIDSVHPLDRDTVVVLAKDSRLYAVDFSAEGVVATIRLLATDIDQVLLSDEQDLLARGDDSRVVSIDAGSPSPEKRAVDGLRGTRHAGLAFRDHDGRIWVQVHAGYFDQSAQWSSLNGAEGFKTVGVAPFAVVATPR